MKILTSKRRKYKSIQYTIWIRQNNNVTKITDKLGTAHINPYRYRSYRYDRETDLYYLQSRYYNPEWGRFINTDAMISTGQGLLSHNMYAYCENNSINRMDPSGNSWCWSWKICYIQELECVPSLLPPLWWTIPANVAIP